MDFKLKKRTGAGLCPVAYCRKRTGKKKRFCHAHHAQTWRSKNPLRAAFVNLRGHAKARKKVFLLTFDEFSALAHAGSYLDGKGCTRLQLHFDRIREDGPYSFENCQVISCHLNVVKQNDYRKQFVKYFSENTAPECPF